MHIYIQIQQQNNSMGSHANMLCIRHLNVKHLYGISQEVELPLEHRAAPSARRSLHKVLYPLPTSIDFSGLLWTPMGASLNTNPADQF